MCAHNQSAPYYDLIFESSFGPAYQQLTALTLQAISDIVQIEASIIDIGAGTGRLSLPLCEAGHSVTAIEPCDGLYQVLVNKMAGIEFNSVLASMAEFNMPNEGDLALAVFTVMAYITDLEEMKRSLANVSRHLRKGGYFFFDLPNDVFFTGYGANQHFAKPGFTRDISILPVEESIYSYTEHVEITINGDEVVNCEEDFPLRNWRIQEIESMANECGLRNTGRVFPQFSATGSTYYLFQKTDSEI